MQANKSISKHLRTKTSEFISGNASSSGTLEEIIQLCKQCIQNQTALTPVLLSLETVFTYIIENKHISASTVEPKPQSPEAQYKQWLRDQYDVAWTIILSCFEKKERGTQSDSIQALATSMKLLSLEGGLADSLEHNGFPETRLKSVLEHLLSASELTLHLVTRFQEFTVYHDVLFHSWKLLYQLTPKKDMPNETFIRNYLNLMYSMPITDWNDIKRLVRDDQSATEFVFDYQVARKCINKCWNCVMQWHHTEQSRKLMLVVLLERLLKHIEKPMLLTDFLMDSLDMGGPISLLALQGVFTLIQEHNLTYPSIYKKLYSMFEPEIFHTKYKPRLFYLADLFLSSTHLPENLIAAFVKRLARLTLVAPPQDIIICLYFLGNLLIRHPALKRLIHNTGNGNGLMRSPRDPYVMDETEPTKSFALESSLWEIEALLSHALPNIVNAAKFVTRPLPKIEYDLTQVLEVNENDIFDKTMVNSCKSHFLATDRPDSMFLPQKDHLMNLWNLF